MPPMAPPQPGRHGRATNLVNALPIAFHDARFRWVLAQAMQRCKAVVAHLRSSGAAYTPQGVVIRRDKDGVYRIATSPPSSNVAEGLEQLTSRYKPTFAGARVPIEGAKALVIAVGAFTRDNGITNRFESGRWIDLALSMKAPVVVSGARASTWIFTPRKQIIQFDWKWPYQ